MSTTLTLLNLANSFTRHIGVFSFMCMRSEAVRSLSSLWFWEPMSTLSTQQTKNSYKLKTYTTVCARDKLNTTQSKLKWKNHYYEITLC